MIDVKEMSFSVKMGNVFFISGFVMVVLSVRMVLMSFRRCVCLLFVNLGILVVGVVLIVVFFSFGGVMVKWIVIMV